MVPSLLGLAVLLVGLVMIHYGIAGTVLPLTPVQAPPMLSPTGMGGSGT